MNDQIDEPSLCETSCKQVEVPTEDEVEALNAMREVKERARSIKGRISKLSAAREKHLKWRSGPDWKKKWHNSNQNGTGWKRDAMRLPGRGW